MFEFFTNTKEKVPAYADFLLQNRSTEIKEWEDIPLSDKQNYLLKYPIKSLAKEDISHAFLIGTSSGFSKSGSVFWLKEAVDEKAYLEAVKALLIADYEIDKKKTLIIVSLAFGTWVGGIQLASTLRNLAASMDEVTIATPGLNIKEAVEICKEFGEFYETILWVVNPSSINLIYPMLQNEKTLLDGKIFFPVVGEYFSENFREEIALKFGHTKENPFVLKTGYGSADAGDLGIESLETIALRKFLNNKHKICQKLFSQDEAPMIFIKNEKTFIETIDGELVVTKDQFIPLIRYNTKDNGGVLKKEQLKEYIESSLYEKLPDTILYVFGRASNNIIFYGTNLNVTQIGDFLSSLQTKEYAGLFELSETKEEGVSFFEFTIYVQNVESSSSEFYLKSMLNFLKKRSNEFAFKYQELSKSMGEDLIRVQLKDIEELQIDKKHKYIRESHV